MRITYFNKCEMTFKLYKQCIKMKTEKKKPTMSKHTNAKI